MVRFAGRARWLAVVALIALTGLGACKGKEQPAEAAVQAAAESDDLAKQESDLLARRDALVKARKRINDGRAQLAEQRRAARASGQDTSELDKADDKLLEEEKSLADQESQLNDKYDTIINQRRDMIQALASSGGQAAQVAAREAAVAAREKDFSRREQKLAEREATLAERERAQAKREKETCGVAAAPAPIIVDAKGSKYTKKDVEPLLRRARSDMSKKGILSSDLPGPVQGLEKEATSAMGEGDYGRARFAAAQLVASINAIKIDKGFIAAKIQRLNAAIKGKQLSAADQDSVRGLFRDATADYGDGKFSSANRKLNKIWAVLR